MNHQTSFDTFATEQELRDEHPDPWKFDEYGPTMKEPLPFEETAALHESGGELVDEREIPDSGLSLSDITDWTYINEERDYPERRQQESEQLRQLETSSTRAIADGGTVEQVPTADPDDPPKGETVRLITGITGLMHSPRIIEGETSSTGKTISVGGEDDDLTKNGRLDAETIFSGESEFRDSRYFEIYTPGRYRSNQRANHAPGPQAGSNGVSDVDELPEPTHWPTVDEPTDAPDECPECGAAGPWNDVGKPRCEHCGETVDPDQGPADAADEDGSERPGYQDIERGDTLIIDGYRGQFVITNVSTFIGTDTTNYLEAVKREGGEWSMYKIQKGSPYKGDRSLKVNEDAEVSVGINVNNSQNPQDFEITGSDMEQVRRYIRDTRGGA